MALLQWDSRYNTGVPHFDAQHQTLFSLFNDLHDAISAGRAEDVLADLLNGLVRYAQTHFADEERFMDQTSCPTRDEHKAEHARFAARVQEFQGQLARGEAAVTHEVMDMLTDWLLDHVQGIDQNLTAGQSTAGTAGLQGQ